jgi:hypothetical protein
MKNKLSQKDKVLKLMREQGFVTRNWALQNYISRLSAIMLDLKNEGVNFEAGDYGTDYKYTLLDKPKEIKRYFVGGVEVAPPKIIW